MPRVPNPSWLSTAMLRPLLIAVTALLLSLLLAYSAFDSPARVSPQGCRMSYMSPSYVLQTGFNASWTVSSLATRYRLKLYREVGWDDTNQVRDTMLKWYSGEADSLKLRGTPVLFIPGNAGSANQCRSIASSASRQYYFSPSHVNAEFASRGVKPLDVFAGTPTLILQYLMKLSLDQSTSMRTSRPFMARR